MSPRLSVSLLVASLANAAGAQSPTGQVTSQAVVVTVGMSITPLRDLQFGAVPLGVPTSVAPDAPNAGAWAATGSPNALVSISFTLPTALRNVQAVPGVTLPIGFGAAAARWRRAVNDPGGATAFDPAAGTTGRFGPPPNPTLYIWIGGTVSPSPTQLPGIYTGTVILQLAYL
ncbi:MAG TPA: hypothetical protein VNI61_10610 [Gemmatimonadales bacterium]|nr:hypothetical protein [Gemmatimonadales bacterium]